MEQLLESQTAIGTGTSFLKRVTGRTFTISNLFIHYSREESRKIILMFFTKRKSKAAKTISANTKSTDLVFTISKKSHLVTLSL
jgi:hypothetical protein